MGPATRAHPTFGMTLTQAIKGLFAQQVAALQSQINSLRSQAGGRRGGCFPGMSIVITPSGKKCMKDLTLNELVLAGEQSF